MDNNTPLLLPRWYNYLPGWRLASASLLVGVALAWSWEYNLLLPILYVFGIMFVLDVILCVAILIVLHFVVGREH